PTESMVCPIVAVNISALEEENSAGGLEALREFITVILEKTIVNLIPAKAKDLESIDRPGRDIRRQMDAMLNFLALVENEGRLAGQ
ncbi:hypothetical protein HYT04_02945, partial [Candidatus Kaiserbacteria bacterium]|nr:hypothetical protein [Candidatus Kaiserbacteria bacterium]